MASDATIQCTLQYPPEDGVSNVQIPKSATITGFTEKIDSTFVLGIGAEQELNLGSVGSAKALYISADQDVTVHINAAATGFDAAFKAKAYRFKEGILGEMISLVFAGDGGTTDIGIQGLSGAAERNSNIIYCCYFLPIIIINI